MIGSHAEHMPVTLTGAFLSGFWARAKAVAIAAAEKLTQAHCGVAGGHSMALRFEKSRVSLGSGDCHGSCDTPRRSSVAPCMR